MSVDEVWAWKLRESCRQYQEQEITTKAFRDKLRELGYKSYDIEREITLLLQTRKSVYQC